MKRFATALLVVAMIAASAATLAATRLPSPPPLPPAKPVTETIFGQRITDPYRYFENASDPTVVKFFKDQNAYARSVLSGLGSARARLLKQITDDDYATAWVPQLIIAGTQYFYLKQNPGDDALKLYVRDANGSQDRLLVDPNALATPGKHYDINYFLPSNDGAYVVYGISEGGSENAVLRVVQVATGKVLPDAIDRSIFSGASGWLPDNKSFYYERFPKMKPGESSLDQELRSVDYIHVLGVDSDRDVPVFGFGLNASLPFESTDIPNIITSPSSPYVLGVINHGVKNELTIYAVRADQLTSASAPWKKIADVSDEATGFDFAGSTIYLLTHHNAPSYKVIATSLDAPDIAHATTVLAPSREIVLQISAAHDGIYIRSRLGGFARLRKLLVNDIGAPQGAPKSVNLPIQGTIDAFATHPLADGGIVAMTSWTVSTHWYHFDATGQMTDPHIRKPNPIDMSPYTSAEVEARSQDGTMVPLSVVYPKALKRNGKNPTLLNGYSSYGITDEPGFSPTGVAWLQHGGVYADCHARGDGWFGEAWHLEGMKSTKHHTWEDFVACGEWLVQHGFTSPSHLAGEGTSAGGITIGRAITSRPDLFAAAIDEVGASNMMRMEFSPNGPPNIPEFGSIATANGARDLYAMDSYLHVKDGTKYPAVMFVTGNNDHRVAPWQLGKFAARLQQASSSGRPILLRIDYDAGHAGGAARQQHELIADEYAFLLWQFGDPAFASTPTRLKR
jgi:prolyl oligopeptidase